ncbi:MAG TPA: TetR family transcriptional regulator [Solirubrobacterales bacterium]
MPKPRDPVTKRQKILDAALEEFAAHGLSGSRIDRIAAGAGVSPGHAYSFHKGKDELFEAVYEPIVRRPRSRSRSTPRTSPGYAGLLFDVGIDHPEVTRFMAWYGFESGSTTAGASAVSSLMSEKVAAVEATQARGTVSDRFGAAETLALVLAVANMWQSTGEGVSILVPAKRRRALVLEAVRRTAAPDR